jgi:hypothetical protein
MKHAGSIALLALADLITAVRARGLTEKRAGTFYRNGKAWLHFHEDKAGLFADIRVSTEWVRFRVSERQEQGSLLAFIDRNL